MEQLKVEGISKSFDGERVLEDISIALNKGELVSLLGISGGGKTTLFNIIAGLSRPDTGHVLLDGEDVTGCPGRVSYMLQKDHLFEWRTIYSNMLLGLEAGGTGAGIPLLPSVRPGGHPEEISVPALRRHEAESGLAPHVSVFRQRGAVGRTLFRTGHDDQEIRP